MNAATMESVLPLFLLDLNNPFVNVEMDGEDPIVPSLNVPTIAPLLNTALATLKETIPNVSAMLGSFLDPISIVPIGLRYVPVKLNNVQDMEIASI